MRCCWSVMWTRRRCLQWGPVIENHARFPARVNVGFLQVVSRDEVRLRVFERGAGETLACGTGACAAVVAGIRLGLLDAKVDVHTHGGVLTIEWQDGRRARRPGVHDRPGHHGVRGRRSTCPTSPDEPLRYASQTMTESNIPPITEDDIANYLANTPDFFERHANVLATVQLTSPHGNRAVSLQERQAEMLREKIKGLELKADGDDPPRPGKLRHRRPPAAVDAHLAADPRCPRACHAWSRGRWPSDFLVPQVAIKVWGVSPEFEAEPYAQGASEDVRAFASSLSLALLRRQPRAGSCAMAGRRHGGRLAGADPAARRRRDPRPLACWCWPRPIRSASPPTWAPVSWSASVS